MHNLPGMETEYTLGIAPDLATVKTITTGARAWLIRAGDISWPPHPKGEMVESLKDGGWWQKGAGGT